MKIRISCTVTPCLLVNFEVFRCTCCLHLEGSVFNCFENEVSRLTGKAGDYLLDLNMEAISTSEESEAVLLIDMLSYPRKLESSQIPL